MTIDQILNYGQYMTAGHEFVISGLFSGCQDNIHVWENFLSASCTFAEMNDRGPCNVANTWGFFSVRGAADFATADNPFRLHLYQFHRAYEQDGRQEAGRRPVIEPHRKAVQTIEPFEYEQEHPLRCGRLPVLYFMVACPLEPGN